MMHNRGTTNRAGTKTLDLSGFAVITAENMRAVAHDEALRLAVLNDLNGHKQISVGGCSVEIVWPDCRISNPEEMDLSEVMGKPVYIISAIRTGPIFTFGGIEIKPGVTAGSIWALFMFYCETMHETVGKLMPGIGPRIAAVDARGNGN